MLVATEQHGGGSKRVFWLRAIGLVVLNGTASQMPTLLICSNPLSNSARDAKKTDQREMVRGFTAPQCPHIPCSKYRIPSMVMALITWHHLTLSQWPGTVMVQGRQSKLGFGDRLALGCQRPLVFLPPPPPTPLPPLELDGAAVVAAEDGGEEDDEDDEQMFFDTSAMEEPARRAPAMYRTLAKLLETGEVTVCGTHTHHTHKPHAHTTHAHKVRSYFSPCTLENTPTRVCTQNSNARRATVLEDGGFGAVPPLGGVVRVVRDCRRWGRGLKGFVDWVVHLSKLCVWIEICLFGGRPVVVELALQPGVARDDRYCMFQKHRKNGAQR